MKLLLVFLLFLGTYDARGAGIRLDKNAPSDETPNLNDLLQQFLAFIPLDDETRIFMDYLESDPDVQKAVLFLYSDSFATLVSRVDNSSEYKKFLSYLYDSGIDIYRYVNKLHELLDLPPFQPQDSTPHLSADESGVIRMINDMLKLLPLQDILNWYNTVCYPNPNFQELLTRIRSPEFKQLVSDIMASNEYDELTSILKSFGIDVQAIEQMIKDFLNGNGSRLQLKITNSLKDRFTEFMAMVPKEKLEALVLKYIENNKDVQDVFNYLKSGEFSDLVVQLEGTQQLIDVLNFVQSHGINVYDYLNSLLNILGIPNFTPPPIIRRVPTPKSGLTDLFDDIKNLLPLKDMLFWYIDTCEPDTEYQQLLTLLRSDDFKVVVNVVYHHLSFNTIHDGLIKLGVDVRGIEMLLQSFLGW
ncbi:uncharacterized protein LOC124169418 [Ischnura elegans]|uniref:uncharacterized protein LOC124169418 n=1 Tax=Ischnura elegans TaxID=197161 RepID=UPI001ED88624|nr:uncharacterized protein LOC124169418 [Ischnura elegans]